ncbi:hypothetical protein GCM10022285_12320 [Streptomyces tunisiensis]|uniref:N-acetylmuramic acid 6-phosphate etherase n=1 Tax=Streptomyces tunisiensis TaxID=948699 RepID=A0ABP7XWM6_9ACTN
MISTITMIRLGKTYGNLMVDVRASKETWPTPLWATGRGDAAEGDEQ